MLDVPKEIVDLNLVFPSDSADIFVVFDLDELDLVVFFLVELGHAFLLEVHLLHILALGVAFFVEELFDFGGEGAVFRLELSDLVFEVFVFAEEGEVGGGGVAVGGLGGAFDEGLGLEGGFVLFVGGEV